MVNVPSFLEGSETERKCMPRFVRNNSVRQARINCVLTGGGPAIRIGAAVVVNNKRPPASGSPGSENDSPVARHDQRILADSARPQCRAAVSTIQSRLREGAV